MGQKNQNLPGFRDFYPEDCALRNYLFETWRRVVARYRFSEWEGPILEPTDLYRKKSGDEITDQLFHFVDRGDREVSMRPELTPTLARMAAGKHREYRKPMRWFSIGPFFRFERQQRGRLREFYQFNCDALGDTSPEVDAELIAVSIDIMRELGFSESDFVIRISDRSAWMSWLEAQGIDRTSEFLRIIDKLEPEKPDKMAKTDEQLKALGSSWDQVKEFMASGEEVSERMPTIRKNLAARGLDGFLRWDLGIVRGLAYYTSTVFEVFDIGQGMRAVAGGGRYDDLVKLIGGSDLAAAGFAIGDVVIGDLIAETPDAKAKRDVWLAEQSAIDVFVVVAEEDQRDEALKGVQQLRDSGLRVDYALTATKVGKQFQAAEQSGAAKAVIYGSAFPMIKVKTLADRTEIEISAEQLLAQFG
ncbi:MAG: histidyl-tRNA synthetase [Verrucomicrobiales bacterium]|jgi:histidyl-tRNA synthetase